MSIHHLGGYIPMMLNLVLFSIMLVLVLLLLFLGLQNPQFRQILDSLRRDWDQNYRKTSHTDFPDMRQQLGGADSDGR
jgi:hypothetical protein